MKVCPWTSKCRVELDKHQVTHSFLVVLESLAQLLGRHLLTKVWLASILSWEGLKSQIVPDSLYTSLPCPSQMNNAFYLAHTSAA